MKRDLEKALHQWKSSSHRKPLVLRGARQTGKTTLLQAFGQKEYASVHYFNFEKNNRLSTIFEDDLSPSRIIQELSLLVRKTIQPKGDLIIFDEIQFSNQALNSLKYFCEEANDFHIASAGSLLGVQLNQTKSFPVGKVNFLDLYPMSFMEFLEGIGETYLREYLEGIDTPQSLSESSRLECHRLLKQYFLVGGMPEVVNAFAVNRDIQTAKNIQMELMNAYRLDFSKHAPTKDIPKLNAIWENLPSQLAKENKKFIFSLISKGARARDYEDALLWLKLAGLTYHCGAIKTPLLPLSRYADPHAFKVYLFDVGLLSCLSRIHETAYLEKNELFHIYNGALTECYIANILRSQHQQELYYWRTESSNGAEIDFLMDFEGQVFPIEVKGGENVRSKSLQSFHQRYEPPFVVRTSALNLTRDGNLLNVPLFLFERLPVLMNKMRILST